MHIVKVTHKKLEGPLENLFKTQNTPSFIEADTLEDALDYCKGVVGMLPNLVEVEIMVTSPVRIPEGVLEEVIAKKYEEQDLKLRRSMFERLMEKSHEELQEELSRTIREESPFFGMMGSIGVSPNSVVKYNKSIALIEEYESRRKLDES